MPPQEQDQYDKQAEEMAQTCAIRVIEQFNIDCLTPDRGYNNIQEVLDTIPLASLLRDKARLDWLEQQEWDCEPEGHYSADIFVPKGSTYRQAVDEAMKENKPV